MAANHDKFLLSTTAEPHKIRTSEILKAHPEIRDLNGKNPYTFLFILLIVSLQVAMAITVSNLSWWFVIPAAYLIGAFCNHALFVLIHECAHHLVFKKRSLNFISGILADLPNVLPSSVSFRTYHLKHHAFQGHYDRDADLASKWEARLIGNTFIGKSLWLLMYPVFQVLRPPRLDSIKFRSGWTWINMAAVLVFDLTILYFFGWKAVLYLLASLWFSVGLHPLGARWIQEHYLTSPPQETYSYYGPLNTLAFNVGYHNEHHDFPAVPWNRLPKIRAIAPEYYDTLVYHESWSKLLLKFLFDPNMSLFSRVEREAKR